jgi:hypothetical protein
LIYVTAKQASKTNRIGEFSMEGARNIPPLQVRCPPELKEWIKALARTNRRSLNAELVMLLEQAKEQIERAAKPN